MKPEPMLWLSDARGQYIPRDFANSFADRAKAVTGVDDEAWAILEAGPDHELYWEAWDEVCSDAIVTDNKGNKFTIHQDGDCWLIPEGMEWSDKDEFFTWPKADMGDPSREEMETFLRDLAKQSGEDCEFDIQEAIYWFASDWHGGQSSNLYSALSTSEFHPGACANGCEPESTAESFYSELETKFAK